MRSQRQSQFCEFQESSTNTQKIKVKSICSKGNISNKVTSPEQSQSMNKEDENLCNYLLNSWKITQRNSLPRRRHTVSHKLPQKQQSIEQQPKICIFERYTPQILNYLKAKFIQQQILQNVQKNKLLDLTSFQVIQFMYLVVKRAWCDIQTATTTFSHLKPNKTINDHNHPNSQTHSNNNITNASQLKAHEEELSKFLVLPINKLSQSIQKTLQHYNQLLLAHENSLINKLKAAIDFIFQYQAKNTRDSILLGVETKNFTRDEQIKYTQQHLIPLINKRLVKATGESTIKLIQSLQGYSQIMTIHPQKLKSFDEFQTLKKNVIKKKNSSH